MKRNTLRKLVGRPSSGKFYGESFTGFLNSTNGPGKVAALSNWFISLSN